MIQRISKSQTFVSYADFENEFKHYCHATNQQFVVAKSEVHNKCQDKQLPFKLKELKCAYHRKLGCTAFLRLNLKKAGVNKNKYLIVSLDEKHADKCPFVQRLHRFNSTASSASPSSSSSSFCHIHEDSSYETMHEEEEEESTDVMGSCKEYNQLISNDFVNVFNECCAKVLTNQQYLGLRDFLYFILCHSYINAK